MPVTYIIHPITAIVSNPVRALDPTPASYTNVYQNATLRPIMVIVAIQCFHQLANQWGRGIAYIGATALPASAVGYGGHLLRAGGPAGEESHHTITFIVPSLNYYRVARDDTGGSLVQLNRWTEVAL